MVCKKWSQCAEPEKEKRVKDFCFGLEDWKKYYGCNVGNTSFPQNMWKILTSPSPYWNGKIVKEMHILVLIPKTLNGRPLTLNTMQELIQKPQGGGHAAKYKDYYENLKNELGDQSIPVSYWALMTKGVLLNSRRKNYSEHKRYSRDIMPFQGS